MILRILQGFAQGIPTLHLAKELGIDRKHLLERRHKIQALAAKACVRTPIPDTIVEAEEMYQNAGEKGTPHLDPENPPRRRANKARGPGTWETDRLPVLGVIGRESGQTFCSDYFILAVQGFHADAGSKETGVRLVELY